MSVGKGGRGKEGESACACLCLCVQSDGRREGRRWEKAQTRGGTGTLKEGDGVIPGTGHKKSDRLEMREGEEVTEIP